MTTKTRASKKKKKKTGRKTTKKPKWTILTYVRIERKRSALGLSKASMAGALGVTNSTYHNWRRGTTVPHPNQQEVLKARMDALKPDSEPPKRTAPTRAGRNGSGLHNRIRTHLLPGTPDPKARGTSGGAQCTTTTDSSVSLISVASVPGIAAITVAFIESQKKAPSAGSVVSFVGELRTVLTA